ncbi:MAG: MFS transporter [Burkholderiales bacterium]|nr:MFS transporter [Burkholderiales bacterium]
MLPILNLICGLTIDLYAPSLSEIRNYYGISQNTAHSSITITVLGFAFGQFIFGYLSDYFGRKSTILVALVLYLLASLGIIMSGDVLILLIGRFLQGIAIGSFAINSRAVAVDDFSGVN